MISSSPLLCCLFTESLDRDLLIHLVASSRTLGYLHCNILMMMMMRIMMVVRGDGDDNTDGDTIKKL